MGFSVRELAGSYTARDLVAAEFPKEQGRWVDGSISWEMLLVEDVEVI